MKKCKRENNFVLPGFSLSPLPTVTSGVIVQLLAADNLNDAFGKKQGLKLTRCDNLDSKGQLFIW